MRFGSLFSGVGGFDLGLERAGMECAWQVEFDKQAQSVLRRHWPGVSLHKDVCDVGRSSLDGVDLICGGFPCTDLSVAGKRAGLAGERSGLWWEFHRIIGELAPTWALIENVPGLLSSNEGRDMAVIVRGLEELGYGWSYRVLDSQYFGVPQRRRRVFIVGHLGGPCPPEILLEPESVFRDSPPSREAWEDTPERVARCLRGQSNATHREDSDTYVAHPLTAREGKGPNSDCDSGNLVSDTLRVGGRDQGAGDGPDNTPIVADTLRGHPRPGSNSLGAIAFNATQDPISGAISGAISDQGAAVQVFRKAQKAHDPDDCERWEHAEHAEHANTLNGQGDTAGVVAVDFQNASVSSDIVGTLDAEGQRRMNRGHGVLGAIPRRLTPRECERLQGFPDDWTRYADDGTELADGPRYRMTGNAVTVNVAEWIGDRILTSAVLPDH